MRRERNHVRRGAPCALTALVLVLLVHGSALGQACQVPLSIQKGNVDANIMILLDNSGSMNEAITHAAYDPARTYPGSFDPASLYLVAASGLVEVDGVSAFLVSAPNGQDGRYWGNYLNWIYYAATDEQRAALPAVTRLDVARTVLKAFVDKTVDVFVGLAVFDGADGARIVAECGTAPATLKTLIDGVVADAATPLGEAMEDVLDYYMRTDGGAPIQYDCQKSFLVVMTDGVPTEDLDVSGYLVDADGDGNDPGTCTSIGAGIDDSYHCSDHMDDVAWWMRHNDLIDWLGEPGESWEEGQTVVTYTIGYHVDHPLLAETAFNGDGLYLPVGNAAELWASLESVMVNVRQRVAAGAAVAVVSSESSDEDHIYRGKYNPSRWMGFVDCFELPYKDMEQPVWEAGELLARRDADSRTVFTWSAGQVMDFDVDNAGRLAGPMGVADADEAADLVRWTRGDEVDRFRTRDLGWKLGDIVHSAPKVVGSPSFFTEDMSFQDFMTDGATRERMLYVGANDGMLHAFRASDGEEQWAFIPAYALPMLRDIADSAYCHRFSVDLTPAVCDARVAGAWRTLLVCGARQGGPGYFCLDVTDPTAPGVMWETELPDGLAWGSEVEFARIDGRPVALVGSGLDDPGGDARLYEIDLATGAVLGDLLLSSRPGTRNKATTPSPVDLDFDDETDIAYVGDLLGTVHRIAFRGSTSPGAWSVTTLWSGARPVSAQPKPAYAEGGDINVYFGTGVYLDEPDILTRDQERFYCIIDRHDGQPAGGLADRTDGGGDIGTADGWYVDLVQKDGERVTEPAAVAAETVFFTSFAPFVEPCRSGGESFFYKLDYDDGDAREEEERPGQRKFRGGGIASRPVLDIVNGTVIIQNSNRTITVEDMGGVFDVLTVKAWQEDFDDLLAGLDGGDDDDDGNDPD